MPYIKEVFDVVTFDQAKNTVLTTDPNDPGKFDRETEYFVNVISEQDFITLNEDTVVFDFGCGIGRIAKPLIQKFKCRVIGKDISESMLTFAKLHTANIDRFFGTLDFHAPECVDIAISVLALQHAENPQLEIDNIFNVLKPNGIFVLLNEKHRFVPSEVDAQNFIVWNDDGFNVFDYTESKMKKIHSVPYIGGNLEIIFYKKEQ